MDVRFSTLKVEKDIEVVERKGIGHPDSLADLIAEDFSNRYSRYCLGKYGVIFNHWFDKVTISGGICELGFGKLVVKKPVTIYLFGRVTSGFGDDLIPYEILFRESCHYIFETIFQRTFSEQDLCIVIDVNTAIGADHEKEFYFPTEEHKVSMKEDLLANDSVVCNGFAPYSKAEQLCISLENYLNSVQFKKRHFYTGWDIKVLVLRNLNKYRITACIPFLASAVDSLDFYNAKKKEIGIEIDSFIKNSNYFSVSDSFEVYLNTKDFEDKCYLVAYGTAADKGDYGAVGRGNRYAGIISSNRGTNVEAPYGKNPKNHSGKLYTILAHVIAWKIFQETQVPCEVLITTDNGRSLRDPVFVEIVFNSELEVDIVQKRELFSSYITEIFEKIENLTNVIITTDTISDFKNKNFAIL